MASLSPSMLIVEKTLCELATAYKSAGDVRTLRAFDRENGQFLLIDEGWEGYRRIHAVWAHVEMKAGNYWIHEDGTEAGIANLLVGLGVARDDIILAFHAPNLRSDIEFAAA